jgi:hypothetical protein
MLVTAQYALYDALVSINVPAEKARAVAESLEQKLELLRSSMTIRLGSMQIVGMGLLFAALKLT